ncbi:thiol-disulfide oxidoreductase DCC family protein [Roseovarius aquimarinus]|uniref:Thiol-disulfide oxidoreductase DCC family protein n=1 Tax=Roseovarius aquimarinus TaxID=1229156 RepID=A0ABW7I4F6_9RHOB
MSGAADSDGVTVYYDGACPLCRAELAHYTRRDREGRLTLVDVSKEGANLPEGLAPEEARARFHVADGAGRLASGAAAFALLWRQIPGWKWAGKLARVPGVLPMLELTYRGFLKLRPAIVKTFTQIQARRRKT